MKQIRSNLTTLAVGQRGSVNSNFEVGEKLGSQVSAEGKAVIIVVADVGTMLIVCKGERDLIDCGGV